MSAAHEPGAHRAGTRLPRLETRGSESHKTTEERIKQQDNRERTVASPMGLGARRECSQPSEHATPDPPACCHPWRRHGSGGA